MFTCWLIEVLLLQHKRSHIAISDINVYRLFVCLSVCLLLLSLMMFLFAAENSCLHPYVTTRRLPPQNLQLDLSAAEEKIF